MRQHLLASQRTTQTSTSDELVTANSTAPEKVTADKEVPANNDSQSSSENPENVTEKPDSEAKQ